MTGQQRAETQTAPAAFRPLAFLRCLFQGHDFRTSRAVPNCRTCNRCKFRKRG